MWLNLFLAFLYTNAPVVNLYEDLKTEELATQALYATRVTVAEQKEGFALVEVTDGYKAWIESRFLIELPEEKKHNASVSSLFAHVYRVKDTVYGPLLTLPFGTQLEVVAVNPEQDGRFAEVRLLDGTLAFVQTGDIDQKKEKALSVDETISLSQKFVGLPYTWGGVSSFGFDCSGLVQLLYKQMGLQLKRNARDQIAMKEMQVIPFDKLQKGDLIFCGPSEGRVTHVGFYLGDGKFIQATVKYNNPVVQISDLNTPSWNPAGNKAYPYMVAVHCTLLDKKYDTQP